MKKINISITGGLGRMGQLLIQQTQKDKNLKLHSATENKEIKKGKIQYQKNNDKAFKRTNVIIDFTRPNCTLEVLKLAVKHKKKVVIGTTGFQKKHWDEIKKASKKIAILQSGNMSLGINLMQYVSKILSKGFLSDYQMEVHDDHHIKKIDYPSGTALMLGHAVADGKNKNLKQIQGKIFLNKRGKGQKNKLNFIKLQHLNFLAASLEQPPKMSRHLSILNHLTEQQNYTHTGLLKIIENLMSCMLRMEFSLIMSLLGEGKLL